jgi:hypothetical protein
VITKDGLRGGNTVQLGSLKSNLNLNYLFMILESVDYIMMEKVLFGFLTSFTK